jgi:hypothetical protein
MLEVQFIIDATFATSTSSNIGICVQKMRGESFGKGAVAIAQSG